MKANIEKIAKGTRGKVAAYMMTDQTWRDHWQPDPAANTETEDGTLPKTPDELLQALQRPNRWICKTTLSMSAKALNRDVVVIKKETDAAADTDSIQVMGWFQAKHTGKASDDNVITIELKNKHYYWVQKPDQGWPKELREIGAPTGTFTGGAKTASLGSSWLNSGTVRSKGGKAALHDWPSESGIQTLEGSQPTSRSR